MKIVDDLKHIRITIRTELYAAAVVALENHAAEYQKIGCEDTAHRYADFARELKAIAHRAMEDQIAAQIYGDKVPEFLKQQAE